PSVRRIQWVEDLLPAVDVLAGTGEAVLVDDGVCAGAVHVPDAEGLAEHEVAVGDRELVPVERPDGRTRRAGPLRVVLAAVARTAETAGREHLDQRHFLAAAGAVVLRVVGEARAVRLHGTPEVRAPVRDDREARLAVELAVVTDVRGAAGDLS